MKKPRINIEVMEARSVDAIPIGELWQYEPKWDGFRCLLVRDAQAVDLYSKSGQKLNRYFPEVIDESGKRALPLTVKSLFRQMVSSNSMTCCSAFTPLRVG